MAVLPIARLVRASLPLSLALLGAGCCLSVGPEDALSSAGTGHANAGQATSGQGTAGRTTSAEDSGGSTSSGGSATAGGCGSVLSMMVVPSTLDFGQVDINSTARRSVTVVNCSTAPVTDIAATPGGGDGNLFTVDDAPTSLGAGESATVDIAYAPLGGESRSVATVIFEGSDGEKALLNLFGEPVGLALTVAPNPCDFGYVALDTTGVCCTTVSNQNNVPVTISGVSDFADEGGAFAVATTDDATPPNPQTFPTIPITIQGGVSAKVCFSLTPPATGDYNGQVTLVTDASISPVVQLTGWGGGPQISCVPHYVDFGVVPADSTATVPVLCTNTGSAIPSTNLILQPPTASPSVFSAAFGKAADVYPLNGLAPGQTAQIDVSYTPTGASNDKGTLFIQNNGDLGQTLRIPLTGQGSK